MKQPRPPKQPHEYSPGPLSAIQKGFWAFRHNGPIDPPEYKHGSPVFWLYRKGWNWARLNPTLVPDWAYSQHRAMRKALEMAIRWSQQIDTKNNELMANNLRALRVKWEDCLLREVWIPEWRGLNDRVTTNPDGSLKTKPRGKGASPSKPVTTSTET